MRIETIAVILSLIRECASQPFLKYVILLPSSQPLVIEIFQYRKEHNRLLDCLYYCKHFDTNGSTYERQPTTSHIGLHKLGFPCSSKSCVVCTLCFSALTF